MALKNIVAWLLFAVSFAAFMRSSTFGTFLAGLNSTFSEFSSSISGQVSSEVIFFLLFAFVILIAAAVGVFKN